VAESSFVENASKLIIATGALAEYGVYPKVFA
jgi:hypothetical protein